VGTPVSSTNKTDRHNIAELLLKVALNTINQTATVNQLVMNLAKRLLLFLVFTLQFNASILMKNSLFCGIYFNEVVFCSVTNQTAEKNHFLS
jgi:hypothetical protein